MIIELYFLFTKNHSITIKRKIIQISQYFFVFEKNLFAISKKFYRTFVQIWPLNNFFTKIDISLSRYNYRKDISNNFFLNALDGGSLRL